MTWQEKVRSDGFLGWAFLSAFFVSGVVLTFTANGTAGAGDSPGHYLFARYAPVHPELFFHHWAKPLFVLVAVPFAQFGFEGMKVLNLLLSTGTIFITWQIARHLQVPLAWLSVLFMIFSPALITHTLSGFTEPMFALVLALVVYLFMKDRITASVLLASFLPFVRSEGLIVCGVIGLLLLLEKRWKLIPLLLAGHVVYSIAGYHVYHSLLWVVKEIPYARLSSQYGSGTWWHFFAHLMVITGTVLFVVFYAGVAAVVFNLVSGRTRRAAVRETMLVYAVFAAYFGAHVVFWRFGIFSSMGLARPLVGVLPLIVIIQLRGLNGVLDWVARQAGSRTRRMVLGCTIAAVILFPFTGSLPIWNFRFIPFTASQYAWNYERDFLLNAEQELALDAARFLRENYPAHRDYEYLVDGVFFTLAMDIDQFDAEKCRTLDWLHALDGKKAFVLWDDAYSVLERKLTLEQVEENPNLKLVKVFERPDRWSARSPRKLVLFETKLETQNVPR